MTATDLATLGFAAVLGGATFFAPCAFPLLPGYLAFFLGTADADGGPDRAPLRRAATVGSLASAGFLAVYLVLGAVVAVVGTRALAGLGRLELVVGGLLVLLGVAMATGRTPQWRVPLPERRRSPAGFLLFGVVYAVAAAGCTAPLFLGAVGAALSGGPWLAAATLLSYGAGMGAMMVAVTGAAALGREQVVRRLSASTGRLERAAGVLLALAGVTQVLYYLFWLGGWAALAG